MRKRIEFGIKSQMEYVSLFSSKYLMKFSKFNQSLSEVIFVKKFEIDHNEFFFSTLMGKCGLSDSVKSIEISNRMVNNSGLFRIPTCSEYFFLFPCYRRSTDLCGFPRISTALYGSLRSISFSISLYRSRKFFTVLDRSRPF